MGSQHFFSGATAPAFDGFCRRRYTLLRHGVTGAFRIVDNFEVRHLLMGKRIRAWADVVRHYEGQGHAIRMVMVGLTYRQAQDYEAGHIRDFMKDAKRRLGAALLAWAWVCEMQRRGAPHYHVLFVLAAGTSFPYPDRSGMWEHGSTSVVAARSHHYLVRYVGKAYQKDLARYPRGCRLYAASIRMGPEWDDLYRLVAGLKDNPGGPSEWRYVASTVGLDYAEFLSMREAVSMPMAGVVEAVGAAS